MSLPMTHAVGAAGEVSSSYSKLLTPNEAPRSTSSTTEQPEREETDIIQIAQRLYERAKHARKDREAKWQEYWDYYNGKQWPTQGKTTRARPNVNVIQSVIDTTLPILTDTSPSFGVVARDPNDFAFSELQTDTLRVWWNRRSMNHVMVESLMDSLVTDVGILKVVWNDDIDDTLGDVDVVVRDARNVYVPENAVDFDRNCPWVIDEYYKSRGKLALQFPKFRDEIRRASASNKPVSTSSSDTTVRVVSPVNRDVPAPDNAKASSSTMSDNEDLRVWEFWIDDDTVIEEEQINEDGEPETLTKLKYPHGRLVTILPDAKLVLQDVPNPRRDGEKPFIRIVSNLLPRSFYGRGDVAPVQETQRMLNKVFAVILDWANLMSNPCWIMDTNSGVDPDMVTNQVGQIIYKAPGSEVRREDAPPAPPQLFQLYDTLMQLLNQQSGVHDVTQGRKPAGITAAEAIETLQEAAQTRIRLKERNLLVALQRLARLVIATMLQHYTEARVIALTGRDDLAGTWPTYVRFYVETIENENGNTMYRPVTQKIAYDEGLGQYVEGEVEQGNPSLGQFELDVTTGTSLPFIKQQRSDQAIRLYEDKGIDRKALLDTIDFPEKDAILARMDEQDKQAAQAQAGPAPAPAPAM